MAKRFSPARTKAIDAIKYFRIRAGPHHRFVAVWVVVVEGRVLVRSWSYKPNGWYRAFLAEPTGALLLGDKEVRVRASRVLDAEILDAMDGAYAAKYDIKANAKYVEGFRAPERRARSLELEPT